jgi:hypothetical protein
MRSLVFSWSIKPCSELSDFLWDTHELERRADPNKMKSEINSFFMILIIDERTLISDE